MLINVDSRLSDAIALIDSNAMGACFVVDGKVLVGVITDGDIRRSIVKGVQLADSVRRVMCTNYFSLVVNSPVDLIQKNIQKYKYIPIVNNSGEIVDIASAKQYHQIPLVQPIFDGNELEYVTDCIHTGWISSQGKYVNQFEDKFGEYVGCPNTLAVSNGTVALHLSLVTLGVGPGDEVLVPNLTFASPINAVLYVGATPVLVDVDPNTMTIDTDLAKLAITDKTRAIIPVHLYGQPADMSAIMILARDNNLLVIEDCAEALGSWYQSTHVGNFGDASTFSFFGNKTITTGEGGMVIFKNQSHRDLAKILRDHGMSPEKKYWHNLVGYNYRLTNLQAAIGLAQIEKVDFFVKRKRAIADKYCNSLRYNKFLQLPLESVGVINSYWIYTVVLVPEFSVQRDALINYLRLRGIESRPVFYPLHHMPPYQQYVKESQKYPSSERLSGGGISLPSSIYMKDEEIEYICESINSFFKNLSQIESESIL
jgi:perosamine synthetase